MTFPEFTIENAIEKLENDGIARKTKGFAAICVGATRFDLARENESVNRKSVKKIRNLGSQICQKAYTRCRKTSVAKNVQR